MAVRIRSRELKTEAAGRIWAELIALPAWVLIPQLFLAGGWLRAVAWHGLRPQWWSGQDLTDFVAAQDGQSILGYGLFLDNVALRFPIAISVLVVALQSLVGIGLVLNRRPVAALAIGSFMNVHFMLAGVVNPSVFYVVLAAGIASWHLDQRLSSESLARISSLYRRVSVISVAILVIGVRQIHPENVIEDPAAVLIFLVVLIAVLLWSLQNQQKNRSQVPEVA